MRITDEYDAYCLDEACAFMLSNIDNEKTPRFPDDEEEVKTNPLLQQMMAGQF